ncbi:MAG: hypothetical protein H7Y41_01630 [Hyphomonadaceae bacterium]|nr:hypothetical protein [Clostridia bacterium]
MTSLMLKRALKVIGQHALTIVVGIFFTLFFAGAISHRIGMFLYTLCLGLVYFSVVYGVGWDFGNRDSKSYSTDKPYPFKGLYIGLYASIPSALLVLLYYLDKTNVLPLSWHIQGEAFHVLEPIMRIWFIMFLAFINSLSERFVAIYACVLIVMPLFVWYGYVSGTKKKYLTYGFMQKLMYKKQKK